LFWLGVSASANDSVEGPVSEMNYNVFMGALSPTHSLTSLNRVAPFSLVV